MRLAHRIPQLERVRVLARLSTPVDRFQRAFNEAAVRLAGKCFDRIAGDDAAVNLVLNDLSQPFIRELADNDLETLMAELARIAFGDDTEALAAAEREVLASLDGDSQGGAGPPGTAR
jgi:hypothetical protein